MSDLTELIENAWTGYESIFAEAENQSFTRLIAGVRPRLTGWFA